MDEGNFLPRGGFRRGMLAGVIMIVFAFCIFAGIFPLPKTEIVMASTPIAPPPTATEMLDTAVEEAEMAAIVAAAPDTPDPVTPVDPPQMIATPTVVSDSENANISVSAGADEPATTTSVAPLLSETSTEADLVATIEAVEKPIGGFEPTGQTNIPSEGEDVNAGVDSTNNGLAFETYALTFGDFGGKPLLSIILLAETIEQAEAVSVMTVPVTLGVSPLNPDAAPIIAQYRASGGEVVLILPSNGGLSLQGVAIGSVPEVISMALENTDGVIGVVDGHQDGNADLVSASLSELEATGHALITTTSVELNEGRTTSVIGKLDDLPGKIAVIREMDDAVAKIGNASSGTVLGNASADTISAIDFWLNSQKAQTITIAPVSASILRN